MCTEKIEFSEHIVKVLQGFTGQKRLFPKQVNARIIFVSFKPGNLIEVEKIDSPVGRYCETKIFNSNLNGTSFWVNGDNAFPRKSINGSANQALPITLANFSVSKGAKSARITWTTAEETNGDLFEVQRSRNGKQWVIFQKVKAQGESKQEQSYEAMDHEPFNGENLYRLQMIDKDGVNAYSGMRSVTFEFEPTLLFPNPVSDFVYIKPAFDLEKMASVSIVNSDGVEIYHSADEIDDEIDVRNFKTGAYIVTIKAINGEESTHKMVVVH